MAFNNIKVHEHFNVNPPSSSETTSVPLTSFDIQWLRFHPVEKIFFYTLPNSQSHPSFFFQEIVPNLKSSLSLTLQHFLPIAGKIVWDHESENPIIQYTPNDGISLIIAESDSDFNHVIENTPHEASLSRSFIPDLESSNSFASIISLQVTFFPYSGFSIGITTHHAVFDGKSSTMFIKAWAYLCNKINKIGDSPSLLLELKPLFDRKIIEVPNEDNSIQILSKIYPSEKGNIRNLRMFPFEPKNKDYVRATFALKHEDLVKIKYKVLSKWETFDTRGSKPQTLSSFVLTCAYTLSCLEKANHEVEKVNKKISLCIPVDCRARLEPPIPNNYFGNCVWGHFIDAKPFDFKNEDSVSLIAMSIYKKIKMIGEKGVIEGDIYDVYDKYNSLLNEGFEVCGVAGSNRFGVYEIDFGWGRPEKVEIVSIDRGLTIGLAESKDENGGVEVGLVLNKDVMDLFSILFFEGLCSN